MSLASALNRALSRARDDAVGEDALVEAYAAEFRRAGRETAKAFERLLTGPVVAAADWNPPTVAEVTAWSVSTARIRGAQRSLLAGIGGRLDTDVPGIDFDLTQPVVQKLLDQIGVRAEGLIRDGVRGPAAHAIARSWAEGRSVPQTAKAIREAVGGAAGYRAVALARTDLIGLSNGAGQWAVEQLNRGAEKNGKPKPIQTKTWTSAGDSRVRETHQDADGQTVPIADSYRVGGAALRYPGDPFGPHDEVVNCRCVEIFNEEAVPDPSPPAVEAPVEPRDDFSKIVTLPGPQDLRWNAPATARTRERLTHAVETFAKALKGGAPKTVASKLEPVGGALKVKLAPNLDAHGDYSFMGNSPIQIQIRPNGPHIANTTWHELGHFLDHQALSKEPGFASVAAPTNEMLAFRRAVDASNQAAVLAEQRGRSMLPINWRPDNPRYGEDRFIPTSTGARAYIDYLNDPREQWARAFAQYVARRFGDDAANVELDDLIENDWNPDGAALVPGQWRDDDFGPIADAVENVLRGAGLLDDGGLTAAFWRYLAEIDPRGLPAVERAKPLARLFRRETELRPEEVEDLVVRPAVVAKLLRLDHGSRVPRRADARPPVYPDDASFPSRRKLMSGVVDRIRQTFAAIPFRNTPVIEEPWDGPGEEAKIPNDAGAATLRKMYAWVDPDGDPETKAAYKFPHHKVEDGQPGPANVRGVRNALSRLPQAKIPDGDRSGVEAHLQKHLDRFNEENASASSTASARLFPRPTVAAATVETATSTGWQSDIAFEGVPTGDGRFMTLGSLSWREPPLTLMAMIETPDFGGHAGALVAGRMDEFSKRGETIDGTALPTDVRSVYSTGEFDTGDYGSEIGRMVGEETLRGISVDLAVHAWAFRDPETGEIIDPATADDSQWEKAFLGEYEFAVTDGEIMAATVCPTPAFADARIALLASAIAPIGKHVWEAGDAYAAEHGIPAGTLMTTLTAAVVPLRARGEKLGGFVAGGGFAPLAPPRGWFFRPEPNERTPLTVLDSGEIFGHIALDDTCHTGYVNGAWSQCVRPPKSRTNYADFMLGTIVTEEGDEIAIGKLTVGTGHAPLSAGKQATRDHYDHTGSVAAFVRATDGRYGIWVCGATRNDMTPEQLRDLRANPPSGDWRDSEGNLELQAILAVPVPGYPVKRSQLALSASADGTPRPTALILAAAPLDAPEATVSVEIQGAIFAAAIDGIPVEDALDDLIQNDPACGCE